MKQFYTLKNSTCVSVVIMAFSLLACYMLSSCSARDKVKAQLNDMKKVAVRIDKDKMELWKNKYNNLVVNHQSKLYTFLVYVDSTQCSPCFIKGLYEWDDLLKLENSNKHSIEFLFIMQPRKGDTQMLRSKLDESNFMHPVYIDKKGVFEQSNPQIPKESMYHSFLLDRNRNIIIIGNPIRNENIKKLLLKTINGSRKNRA